MKPRSLRSAERVLRELVRVQSKLITHGYDERLLRKANRLGDELEAIDSAAAIERTCGGPRAHVE